MTKGCDAQGPKRRTQRPRVFRSRGPLEAEPARRGSALAATLIVFTGIAGLLVASIQLSSDELTESRQALDGVQATALAESGIEVGKLALANAAAKTMVHDPLEGIRSMFATGQLDEEGNQVLAPLDLHSAEPLLSNGVSVGEYSTTLSLVEDTAMGLTVAITSSGYYPAAPENLGPKQALRAWDSITVTVQINLEAGKVFDNAYFVNNWGWLYGNNITVNGNARSNGQMDIGGYRPKITGQPLYDSVAWAGNQATLGVQTDEGGLASGWDVVNADRAQGTGSSGVNIQAFESQVEMPNLTDLSRYEDLATDANSSISIGGVTVAGSIVGDDPGEAQNLYLVGTRANPIELNGPVVVRGDVIISGYVTGQGVIYSGGNAYVPDSLEYANGPTSSRPGQNSRQATESWLSRSKDKDFLGLFASENIIVGDYTNSNWSRYVDGWLQSPLNASKEDSGLDFIPGTAAGRDGISGTADDDLLEGDGVFSTETYTDADAAHGLIPDGFQVGDPIPGTGEDIDGDGQFDDTVRVADFTISSPLRTSHWEGNMPVSGIARYSDIASMYANTLEGVFYTNHAFSWVVFGRQPANINGAMIARNESIVYGTSQLNFNYDARLLGGGKGFLSDLLPMTLRPMAIVQWRRNHEDPLRTRVRP